MTKIRKETTGTMPVEMNGAEQLRMWYQIKGIIRCSIKQLLRGEGTDIVLR